MSPKQAVGQVFFSSKNLQQPFSNAFIELWDLSLFSKKCLAKASADRNGKFLIPFNLPSEERWSFAPELVLRIMDREYAYDDEGNAVDRWHVIKSFSKYNQNGDQFDFGQPQVPYWDYQNPEGNESVAFTPRVHVIDGKTPQDQKSGRTLDQAEVYIKFFPSYTKHELIAKFNQDDPSNAEIEESYPVEGSTRELGDVAFSDDFICHLVLNGFNPQVLKKSRLDQAYYVDFSWNGLTQDGVHFAPNTRANFVILENKLSLKSITVQKRIGGHHSAHAQNRPAKTYTKSDAEWERVKRIFRCNYFLFGEVKSHLTGTHLNIEQYIVPMKRHLRQNPIARLLFPHFSGTTAVNLSANKILLSPEGIVQSTSALTGDSVKQMAIDYFAGLNWKDWQPRKPINDDHQFAKVGQLYWSLLKGYCRDYVDTHRELIVKHWFELKNMSDDLVSHALPYKASDCDFYCRNEISDPETLPYVGEQRVAVSALTTHDSPQGDDLDQLVQLCSYLLFHVTFLHGWVNDLQYQMGGEIEFATLGLSKDITNLKVESHTAVPPQEAIQHPFITYLLTKTEYGYITRNEDGDMNPDLVKALVAKRTAFEDLGYDIRSLRSCINV